MDTVNKVKNYIIENSLLNEGDKVVLGLSGGPDSVCLYDILLKLGYDVYPVHINHKFRPGDAEKDQAYCEELCRTNAEGSRTDAEGCHSEQGEEPKHDLITFTYDCKKIAEECGITSEEAGRKARYEAYDKVALELAEEGFPKEKIKIAVAHNANDQAETVLFRVMRGTGVDGLSGISCKRKSDAGFNVVRPILEIDRKEIEAYCEEKKLNPCIDKTNLEPIYTRNKIRLQLLPLIEEEFNENICETLARLAKSAKADSEYLYKEAKASYDSFCVVKENPLEKVKFTAQTGEGPLEEVRLKVKALRLLHEAIRFRVYSIALKEIGMTKDMSKVYLDSIDQVVFSDNGKAWTPIRAEYKVIREHSELIFKKEK